MELPDSPAGRRLRWLIDHTGDGSAEPSDVADQFEPLFLEHVPLDAVLGFLAQSAFLRTAPIVEINEGHRAVALRVDVDGERVNVQLTVVETEPHRISGLSITTGRTRIEALDETPALTNGVDAAIDEHVGPFAAELPAGGIVVGVLRAGDRTLRSFREAPLEGVYDIGSVTKPFTGILLAEMVRHGDVALDDEVARFVPSVSVPGAITIEQLATHTSGLPRIPADFRPTDMSDPYASLKEDVLLEHLSKADLEFEPGTKSSYSNFGYSLLGHVLSVAGGRSYADLLDVLVCRPLGLARTQATAGQPNGAVAGYAGSGNLTPWWSEPVPGAGGVSSTIDDLLAFAAANLDPSSTQIAEALENAQEPRIAAGERVRVALGWHVIERTDGTRVVWHNGGTGGFRSVLALHRPSQTAIVALCNNGDRDPDVPVISVLGALLNA